ncbi:hypothetical protein MUP77_05040, partial [Candidatus Bathyarchaeota archaeon]|nr:hypothetical protein [Candidatus Bathyarchaeota archaeon]
MSTKNQARFPKELLEAAIAHSKERTLEEKRKKLKEEKKKLKEEKKKLVTDSKILPSVNAPAKTPRVRAPSRPVRSEMSQTTPKVGNDFEKVFSKVIGARELPETRSADYSETYQRAFGRLAGEKSPPPKQAKQSIKPAVEAEPSAKPIPQEKARSEGF